MQNESTYATPAAPGGLSAFWLKVIAITGMFLQHMALALPGAFAYEFEVFLQISGGFTMPIMMFLLVEGFRATSNLDKYLKRVGLFAAISMVPHLFALGSGFNVMFTLLFGLLILRIRRSYGNAPRFWLAFIFITLASFPFDWGIVGPICIFLLYEIRNEKARRILMPVCFAIGTIVYSMLITAALGLIIDMNAVYTSSAAMFFPVGSLLTIPLLLMYKGKRGQPMKWFFYVFYPAHFVVLAVISIVMGKNNLINMVQQIAHELSVLF